MNSGTTVDAAAILAAARRARAAANAAEAEVLAAAVEWAHVHTVTDLDDAATWWSGSKTLGQDTGIPIAGQGCPLVSEFAVAEFATALGLSDGSGRNLFGQALELAHRLPKLWARVQAGTLATWRARRVAEHTVDLSEEAAAWVDAQVAPYAHRTGVAQTQRLVETAIAQFMPDRAAEQRQRAADQRYLTIAHDQVSFAGTSRVHGELDLADALDVDDAITALAQRLADLGSTDSLEVRRAAALGMLARGEQPLDLEPGAEGVVSTGSTTGPVPEPVEGSTGSTTDNTGTEPVRTETGRVLRRPRGRRRDVVLYVHLSEDAIRSGNPDAPVFVENAGGQLLTAGQVAEWCGRPDTDRVIVKPVRDLTRHHHPDHHGVSTGSTTGGRVSTGSTTGGRVSTGSTTGYRVPDQMAEEIDLRDRTCVFPWCHRPARACDHDHTVPHDRGGPTCPCNLAPLCRLHHRMKTHGGWTYTMVEPGTYLWRSPYGYSYLRDPDGTTDLTPPPVDPPPP